MRDIAAMLPDLFGRTGFAADIVTRNIGQPAGAVGHDIAQKLAHRCAGFRFDDLFAARIGVALAGSRRDRRPPFTTVAAAVTNESGLTEMPWPKPTVAVSICSPVARKERRRSFRQFRVNGRKQTQASEECLLSRRPGTQRDLCRAGIGGLCENIARGQRRRHVFGIVDRVTAERKPLPILNTSSSRTV